MLDFKIGVQLTITEAVHQIIKSVHLAFIAINQPCIITSGSDGTHKEGSKHYSLEAIDFRTRHLQPNELATVVKAAKNILGKDFDVVVEATHLHVEYDPKVTR